MNRDSALDLAREIRCPRQYRFLRELWILKRGGNAAVADFRRRVLASDDHDSRRFLVYAEFPRDGWARIRLRSLVLRRPEALVTDLGGKDRR
jgi:hypothetical protein